MVWVVEDARNDKFNVSNRLCPRHHYISSLFTLHLIPLAFFFSTFYINPHSLIVVGYHHIISQNFFLREWKSLAVFTVKISGTSLFHIICGLWFRSRQREFIWFEVIVLWTIDDRGGWVESCEWWLRWFNSCESK